jgi:L-amino acid N-acyltransferase YncA
VDIREATPDDWSAIWPFFRSIVAAGESYAYPEDLTAEQAGALWMEQPPGRVTVAVHEGRVVGSAKMGPNRPGRGSHIATASFMVDPTSGAVGAGRALAEEMVRWAGDAGYHGIQFNAVVETNERAVRLWRSLRFEIVGTVPGAFASREHGYVGLHVMFLPLPR